MRRWYWQRVSAVILLAGVLVLAGLVVESKGLSAWQAEARTLPFRVLVSVVAVAWLVHAWAGLLDVAADYIHSRFWRELFLLFWAVWLLGSLVWLLNVMGWWRA